MRPAAVAVSLVAALTMAMEARAAGECGPAQPGVEIRCTPESYDAAEGSILYGTGLPGGDISLRLADGLSVAYDRDAPDDELDLGDFDPGKNYRYGAVVSVPGGSAYTGGVSVSSSAVVAATGTDVRGYLVGHRGASGNVRLDLDRGSVTTSGIGATGILGFHTSRGDIAAGLRGTVVRAEGDDGSGLHLRHTGTGDIDLGIVGGSIDAAGARSRGIVADHTGTGDTELDLRDLTVSASGEAAYGIFGTRAGAGDYAIDLRNVSVRAEGAASLGAFIRKEAAGAPGDLFIGVEGTSFVSEGPNARGLHADYRTEGDIAADLDDVTFRARGDYARGFNVWSYGNGDLRVTANDVVAVADGDVRPRGFNLSLEDGPGDILVDIQGGNIAGNGESAIGLAALQFSTGDIGVDLRDLTVSGTGETARGLLVEHSGTGDIGVDARNGNIAASGTSAIAVFSAHSDTGDITAELREVAVSAASDSARGLGLQHTGTGDIDLDVHAGSIDVDGQDSIGIFSLHGGTTGAVDIRLRNTTVTARGDGGFGIRAIHRSGRGSIRIRIDDGAVLAENAGGTGIDIGTLDVTTGELADVAELGEDGYRKQSVVVNGRVRGGPGDGTRDTSGIWLGGGGRVEIGPRGSVGAASGTAVQVDGDAAALHVSADFDGRRAAEVFDGAIRNRDGRTTIVVNGLTLHDGVAGATGVWVPNGARDVTVAAADAVVGRTFTAADFVTGPYAPRAAVYESLPGFLLRLDGRGTAGGRLRHAGSPAWVRVSGGRGSHVPERASVGASFDYDRFGFEAGFDFGLSSPGNVTGTASLRHVRGSADVSAPTGGGEIVADGVGVSVGAGWHDPDIGYYADGRVSLTRYEADLRSSARGRLKDEASATVRGLRVEAGRRLGLGEAVHLTPRAWLSRTDVSLDGFRDAVGSRVSLDGTGRSAGGLGIVAQAARDWDGGERSLSLRGELGVERTLWDAETVVDVSGERLHSEGAGTRMVLALGGEYRWGGYTLGGRIAASGPGSDDSNYAAGFRLGKRF